MNLKLKWTNLNVGAVTVKIYRGAAPLDRANLGTALATLTAGESEWTDTTAVRGATYYYVFETISATDRSVSQNQKVVATNRRGPGPQLLVAGDMEYGYLGEIATVDFIDIVSLRTALNMAVGNATATQPTWHKYVRKGKILIVPNRPLATTIQWGQIYSAGLVYGTDDNGKGNFLPGTLVNQKRTVKIGPDTYLVRLMTGYSDVVTDIQPTSENVNDPSDAFSCEWDDLIYPLFQFVPNKQRLQNTANYTSGQMGMGSNAIHCQERGSSTSNCARGSATAGRQIVSQRALILSTTNLSWWPVLELIESAV
jgi:hypothetical protein